MLKTTALTNTHNALNAKMVAFSGYNMPIWYHSAKDEHLAVRQAVGIFDVSHMGMVHFKGPKAFDQLQALCTNNIEKTKNNRMVYTMILNEDGGILDDVMVGHNDDLGAYFMVINAANKEKIIAWFLTHGVAASDMEIHFDDYGLLAIQGPRMASVIPNVLGIDLTQMKPFQSELLPIFNSQALITRSGYTGEDGIEISAPHSTIVAIWEACLSAGVTPCGLAARDSLRIEYGLPLYGHELGESITPLQTRYQWVLGWETPFIGVNALRKHKEKPTLKTVGLQFDQRCLPRQGHHILDGGTITSGTFSPVLNAPIAMAMVPASIQIGDTVTVAIRQHQVQATVCTLPFI
jgi:aminomethyltransferase